jgi:7-cyano-7-deazaguanine synthase in queuosine biosynthesis
MTSFLLRTREGATRRARGVHYIDIFEEPAANTASVAFTFEEEPSQRGHRRPAHRRWSPIPAPAGDLLWLAIAAFVADKVPARGETPDGWTRDLVVEHPRGVDWTAAEPIAQRALSFVSGDHWGLRSSGRRPRLLDIRPAAADVVCLFSGGLDSLIGAIDLLERDPNRRVLLAAVRDARTSVARQTELFRRLHASYGERVALARMSVQIRRSAPAQERPLPVTAENTTRARSLLFIAWGLVLASAAGPDVPLYMPENGLIGINVPLIASRSGSASTRTTHPHFMSMVAQLRQALGITNPIQNPFRLMTKGEAAEQCANRALLGEIATRSISCAHPARTRNRSCGWCYPCLIRRASLARVDLDTASDYELDVLTASGFVDDAGTRADTLRALVRALSARPSSVAVLRNGPIPAGEAGAFADVYARGMTEVGAFLSGATDPALRARFA